MSDLTIENTSVEIQAQVFQNQKTYFRSQKTKSYQFRKDALKKIKKLIKERENDIFKALSSDFGKHSFETYVTEIGQVYEEIDHALKNLSQWMRPKRVSTPLLHFPSSSKIYYQPKGVCLIIGPWNYPFNLIFVPIVAAISAGNTCMVKPPEETPNTSKLIKSMINDNFEEGFLYVVEGEGKVVVPQLMENHRFDHVFFTGSVPVGKIIAKMAAEKLVPTTLELGGKSPCIVDKSASLETSAKRIAFSKMVNSGQTCVAPDYLLVHEDVQDEFLDELRAAFMIFYGGLSPTESEDMAQIVNQKRYETLKEYLKEGRRTFGGITDDARRKIAPTLIMDVKEEDKLFSEEIFGPIMPVYLFKDHDEAIELIEKNPNPLALYIYAKDKKVYNRYVNEVPFGGGCINNGLLHLGNPELPFGGIGNSGQGNYHGKSGFMTFSHEKSILKTSTWFDLDKKYPPYGKFIMKVVRYLMN